MMKELKNILKYVKNEKRRMIFAFILFFLSGISNIFEGYLNGVAIDSITKQNIQTALIALGIYFIVSVVFCRWIGEISKNILYKIEIKLSNKLGLLAYSKALNLPAYAYEEMTSGEVINRIVNDRNSFSNIFGRIISIVIDFVAALIIFVYICFNSYIIAINIIVHLIILYLFSRKYNALLKKYNKEEKEANDKYTSLVNESIIGIRDIKTLGIKSQLKKIIKNIQGGLMNVSLKRRDVRFKYTILISFFKKTLEISTFVICVFLIFYGKSTITFFIAMTYYIYRYMWLIEGVHGLMDDWSKLNVSLTRINEILDNKKYADDYFGNQNIKKCKGIIEFKNVTFAYPNEENIFNDFSIKLEPNKKIAIVGSSGQGKSTLFNLITRIFEPQKGNIYLDGIDIKELSENCLRNNISIIRQSPFIFNKTIKENFKLIKPSITDEEIKKYCKLAYIDEYIESLPDKYDTLLGENGVNLSGGQKQRLAIARTLSKNAKVILFDEATSSLDNNSQEYIKKAIDNLVKNHTIIIVAHRLSTIIDADIIYIVDKGKVIASGTHKSLLKSNKIYSKLYKSDLFE